MSMRGSIQKDPILVNNYTLTMLGFIPFIAVEISGLEDELVVIELPDRTVASGGFRKATEFSMKIPLHHLVEQSIMETWFLSAQDPISPTYKLPATLTHNSHTGSTHRSYALSGVFPKKRKLPDLEMKNDGDLAVVEWMMSVDDVKVIPA